MVEKSTLELPLYYCPSWPRMMERIITAQCSQLPQWILSPYLPELLYLTPCNTLPGTHLPNTPPQSPEHLWVLSPYLPELLYLTPCNTLPGTHLPNTPPQSPEHLWVLSPYLPELLYLTPCNTLPGTHLPNTPPPVTSASLGIVTIPA